MKYTIHWAFGKETGTSRSCLFPISIQIIFFRKTKKESLTKHGVFWNHALGIQSPSENGNGTEILCVSEVIIYPNHHLTFGDWIPPWMFFFAKKNSIKTPIDSMENQPKFIYTRRFWSGLRRPHSSWNIGLLRPWRSNKNPHKIPIQRPGPEALFRQQEV